jgi:hypothetical protein
MTRDQLVAALFACAWLAWFVLAGCWRPVLTAKGEGE